jgi:hypothetical protein
VQPDGTTWVIKFGIALHEWCAEWYGRLAKDLETGKETRK